MIRKDKVFELRIEEDDDVSGIDSISLVDEPAIDVTWVAFNKEKEYDFHIPDGEDESYLNRLFAIGSSEDELLDEGWEVYKVENVTRENFSDPNGESELDDEFLVRFKYAKNPDAPGNSIKATTRDFCRSLVSSNFVYRFEDFENLRNDNGDLARTWRGGYNCRHLWQRILYKRTADISNDGTKQKGRIYTGPSYTIPGNRQPSTTVPSRPSFSKQGFVEDCPSATEDVKINLKNRQNAIDTAHYGPLNPNEPNEDYWKKKADMFGGDIQSAKKSLCGNCAFFVQTKSMLDCIANGINDVNEWDTIDAGDLGYCEAFDFKCAASRTCDAWVVGGPITEESEYAEVGPKGGIVGSDKAPKSGTPNKDPKGEGSAKGDASGKRGAKVTAEQEKTLQNKVDEFNQKESNTKNGRATLGALKSVFQRGLGAFNTSHSPVVKTAEQWAYARVNAFLYIIKNGRPENPKYDTDYDLLPKGHPKAQMSAQDFIECEECGHSWDIEDGGIDIYVCHKCGYDNKDNFESISDYPESISNNAKKGIELNEKVNNKCATQVGKVRAQQLANGEAISLETVKRMYSFLSRAESFYNPSDTEACGTISFLLWGGKSALSWAESKMNDFGYDVGSIGGYVDPGIRKKKKKVIEKSLANPTLFANEDKKAQYFAADNEKQMVLGPAMIPNVKIFRKDKEGVPYYVYFSPETIKMIASKYMKNKYTDNNDQMHDGEAVKDVFVVESWIKESKNDKSTDYGFGDLPVGTWFVAMKINNMEIWDKVKKNELNGFSVSGFFEEIAAFKREEMFLQKVAEILSNIKD